MSTLSRLALVLACMLAVVPTEASAQSVSLSDTAPAARWVAQRLRAARAGAADLVELPLVTASEGWGCICPRNYIGADPDGEGGVAWLSVTAAPGVTLPEVGMRGGVVIAEGYFTGAVSRFTEAPSDGPQYDLATFVVTRVVRRARRDPETLRLRVVTAGAFRCSSVVRDTTPLRVRAEPRADAEVVTELADGTPVTLGPARGAWWQLSAPAAGWVHREHLETTCVARTP